MTGAVEPQLEEATKTPAVCLDVLLFSDNEEQLVLCFVTVGCWFGVGEWVDRDNKLPILGGWVTHCTRHILFSALSAFQRAALNFAWSWKARFSKLNLTFQSSMRLSGTVTQSKIQFGTKIITREPTAGLLYIILSKELHIPDIKSRAGIIRNRFRYKWLTCSDFHKKKSITDEYLQVSYSCIIFSHRAVQ